MQFQTERAPTLDGFMSLCLLCVLHNCDNRTQTMKGVILPRQHFDQRHIPGVSTVIAIIVLLFVQVYFLYRGVCMNWAHAKDGTLPSPGLVTVSDSSAASPVIPTPTPKPSPTTNTTSVIGDDPGTVTHELSSRSLFDFLSFYSFSSLSLTHTHTRKFVCRLLSFLLWFSCGLSIANARFTSFFLLFLQSLSVSLCLALSF